MIQEHYDMKLEDEKKTTEADDSTGDYIRQYENEVDCLEFKINSEQDRLEVQSFPSPVEANAFWTDVRGSFLQSIHTWSDLSLS